MVRQGPFTEQLPEPLEPAGLGDVRIGDASAANRIDALQLKLATPPAASVPSSLIRGLPPGGRGFRSRAGEDREIKELYGRLRYPRYSESYCAYLDPNDLGVRRIERPRVRRGYREPERERIPVRMRLVQRPALFDYAEERPA